MIKNIQHKKRIRPKGFDYKGCYRYSLTFCTRDRSPQFGDDVIVRHTADILQETARNHKFKIWSFCFMPDHLHVLVEGESPTSDMRNFSAAFKQMSGYWFCQMQRKQTSLKACPTKDKEDDNTDGGQGYSLAEQKVRRARLQPCESATLKGRPTEKVRDLCKDLWQINYYEHVLRSDEATEKVARYILENPVRMGLVKDFRDYHFSWCEVFGFVGQGLSLANDATLKGCPTKNKRTGAGFTLIEIVITIVLIGIISGIAAMIILEGVRAYSGEQSRGDVHYQAKLAVERMAREIRLIRSQTAADIPTMNATNIMYTDISGNQMGFKLNSGIIQRTQDNGTTWQTLATGVTSLNFSYLQQDGVTAATAATLWLVVIDVTDTQGSESLEIRTRVHPRNF